MDGIPRWLGLGREWQLAQAAWRALPDNPLWVLSQHMAGHRAPRLRRSQQLALVVWGTLAGLLYALVLATAYFTTSSLDFQTIAAITVFGFVAPLAGLWLLNHILQLAFQAQTWLGRERGDARHVQQALVDPLLGLTLLEPREIVIAALRSLLPLIIAATAVAAGAAVLVILTAQLLSGFSGNSHFLLALLSSPLTLAGYLLGGVLGGIVLLLLSFSLGLNSVSPAQRSALALLLAAHQLACLPMSLAYLPDLDSGASGTPFLALMGAAAYLLAAGAAGLAITAGLRRAAAGWLLAVPMGAVFLFWVALGLLSLLSVTGTDLSALTEPAGHIGAALVSLWGSVSLFAPGLFPSSSCIGMASGGDGHSWLILLHYLVTIVVLVCLLGMAYRGAVVCAAVRLRAVD